MHTFRMIALVSLLAAAGCASPANYQGSAKGFNGFENGKLKRFDVVFLDSNHLPYGPNPAVDILDAGTKWADSTELTTIDKETPRWRRLEPDNSLGTTLFDAAYELTKVEPADHIKWILSLNPLVVGIDTRGEEVQVGNNFMGAASEGADSDTLLIGHNLHLVADADLVRTVGKLYIVDPWDASPLTATKMPLPDNPTITDLFRDRPWEKRGNNSQQ